MMKSLLAAALVILGLTAFVAVQDECATQHRAQDATQSNKTVTSTKSDEENSDNGIYDPKGYTPSWYGFFRWPGGITTWAILLTLLAIVDQTRHVARAAKATEMAAEASLKQAELTKAGMKQWVEFINWKSDLTQGVPTVAIFFQVCNPTSYLLTVEHGVMRFTNPAKEQHFIYRPAPLAPNNPLAVEMFIPIDSFRLEAAKTGTIGFIVEGELTFVDALGTRIVQGFNGLITRNDRETKFEASVLLAEPPKDSKPQKGPRPESKLGHYLKVSGSKTLGLKYPNGGY